MSVTTTQPAVDQRPQALFPLGRVLATSGVSRFIETGQVNPLTLLRRHASGDWGDLCTADKKLNDRSLQDGRLMSTYKLDNQLTIWIITEWDRSVTTLLLPTEY